MAEKKQTVAKEAKTETKVETVEKSSYDAVVSAYNQLLVNYNKLATAFNRLMDSVMSKQRAELIEALLAEQPQPESVPAETEDKK